MIQVDKLSLKYFTKSKISIPLLWYFAKTHPIYKLLFSGLPFVTLKFSSVNKDKCIFLFLFPFSPSCLKTLPKSI